MNYQQALDYLYSFLDSERRLPRTPLEFNLPRNAALLAALGDPQRQLRCVVVAGTKGKGSTAVMLEAIVRAAGLRTGLWTSPHLHSYRERIQVDRVPISQDEFAERVAALPAALDGFDTARYGQPTTFEVGFALALRFFAEQGVDLAVLEVGLGGRYDSANAVLPLVSVITSISYDHMAVLGNTLAEIADQKAGIIKPGVPAITVPQQPEAHAAIARVAREEDAPLFVARADLVERADAAGGLAYPAGLFSPQERLGLAGLFQHENARLAAGAALLLRQAGLELPDPAFAQGLASAQWPGRMELVPGDPPVLLDGAHNGDSAAKLRESLRAAFPGRPVVLVLGGSEGHAIEHILAELVPHAAALVLTRSRHPRAITDLDALAGRAAPLLERPDGPITLRCIPDPVLALAAARELAPPGALVCVTGSLFVVAEAREALGLPNEKD
ncbi:MAG TPA: folylpolyglutamate synthase/dihydrofolate synthase family protein [Roseiflexaceae bacterium]|nr:folylpolyglutamate synthase/dihydrofolate synthase family protein [Roseiflexaceae bacterium]